MSLRVITFPTITPVNLSDVKTHLRAGDDSDPEIVALIASARDFIQKRIQRVLIDTEYQYSCDWFVQEFKLPVSPLISVTSIKYIDTSGVEQTLDSANYQIDTESLVPRIKPAYGKSWPAVRLGYNAVKIVFKTGFGVSENDVPESIKHALLLLIGHWYENREAIIIGTTSNQIEFTVDALLAPYCRY